MQDGRSEQGRDRDAAGVAKPASSRWRPCVLMLDTSLASCIISGYDRRYNKVFPFPTARLLMSSPYAWLALYSGLILAVSLFGGSVPFLGKVTHSRLQLYLSLSAGVMLGASFFHVMPDAMEMAGAGFGWWMALGAVGLFCVERFLAPHSHEVSSKLQQEHTHEPGCA